MLTVRVERSVDSAEWDAAIAGDPSGSVFQTTGWARYYSAYLGDTFHYLTAYDGSKPVGRLLVQETVRGGESAARDKTLTRLARPLLKTFIWRQGPVATHPESRLDVVRKCLHEVEKLAGTRGIMGIEEAYGPVKVGGWEEADAYAALEYRKQPRATVLIDTSQSPDRLLAGLKTFARTRVRKATKQGVIVRQMKGDAGTETFHRLVSQWRREEGFPPHPSRRHQAMAANLTCAFFVAEHGDKPAGALGIWSFNRRGHVFSPVHMRRSRQSQVYAGDLLHWEAIRWCHEQGLTELDLSGVAPTPRSEKERGIRQFKEKWGGRVVEYPVYSKPLNQLTWALAPLARNVRRLTRAIGVGR